MPHVEHSVSWKDTILNSRKRSVFHAIGVLVA